MTATDTDGLVAPKGAADPLWVVQLTDTHLFGEPGSTLMGLDPLASLRSVIELAQRRRWPPDLVLLTGDLSQDGSPAAYRALGELCSGMEAPVYYIAGNHDDPQTMIRTLRGANLHPGGSVRLGAWQVVLLSSTVPGEVGGHLTPAELGRLQRDLAQAPHHHALVCLHHHPVAMGSRWMDAIGLDNPADLFAVLDRHPQVRGVLWGHVHQRSEGERHGVRLMSSPSTNVQFRAQSAEFAVDPQPPGYRWLRLHHDGRIESDVERLEQLAPGLDLTRNSY